MMLFTEMFIDGVRCKACQNGKAKHLFLWSWLKHEGHNVGQCGHQICPGGREAFPILLEIWNDKAQFERAKTAEKKKESARGEDLSDYSTRELNEITPSFAKQGIDVQEEVRKLIQASNTPRQGKYATMSLYALKRLRKAVLAEIRERERPWRRDRNPKYGNLNKGFTSDELEQFLTNVQNKKYRVLFDLMSQTGLRVHEACMLKWSSVDWEKRVLYVFSKKTDQAGQVPLNKRAERLLRDWKAKTDGEFLFPGEQTPHVKPPMAGKWFRKAADRAGLTSRYYKDKRGHERRRLSTHSLRHYFITTVHRNTHDVKVAQRLARHTKAATTLGYIHPSEDELRSAVDSLGKNKRRRI